MVNETTLHQAWGAIRVTLRDAFTFYDIKEIAGLAGIDVTRLASLVQRPSGGASKGQLITALDSAVFQLDHTTKFRILTRITEEIVARRPDQIQHLDNSLERLGWQFMDGRLIPVELFDLAELEELPAEARSDLVKAVDRFRSGDLDGALTAACAAVDSAADAVYAEKDLISQPSDGFQARCMSALKAKGTIAALTHELSGLGWKVGESNRLAKNLHRALNHAAYVMQTLRSRMSDVHGSKRALKPLVFDSLKWAALIVRMLK